jgi:hypothetical protein
MDNPEWFDCITCIETSPSLFFNYLEPAEHPYREIITGGAIGSDDLWECAALNHKMKVIALSFEGHESGSKVLSVLSCLQLNKADPILIKIAQVLGREFNTDNDYIANLLRRDYWIAKYSSQMIAFGTSKDKILVDGETGWEIECAKILNIPIWLFDLDLQEWSKWDGERFIANLIENPKLLGITAGIGTRKLYGANFNLVQQKIEELFR